MIRPTVTIAVPTDAQLAAEWAADVAADPAAVFIDTETTGLGPAADLCDIAIVSVDGSVLLDELIHPYESIPPAATAVHGITDAMVTLSGYFEEVVGTLRAILHGRRVVVWNAEFDAGVVNGLCRRLGIPELAFDWECAMKAYGAFHGERSRVSRGYRWHKLEEAAIRFNTDPGGHRALGDADCCRRVVRMMAEGAR